MVYFIKSYRKNRALSSLSTTYAIAKHRKRCSERRRANILPWRSPINIHSSRRTLHTNTHTSRPTPSRLTLSNTQRIIRDPNNLLTLPRRRMRKILNMRCRRIRRSANDSSGRSLVNRNAFAMFVGGFHHVGVGSVVALDFARFGTLDGRCACHAVGQAERKSADQRAVRVVQSQMEANLR